MRTTIVLDDDLIAEAEKPTGQSERTALAREALNALIQLESARRLALLGGADPDARHVPRRRSEPG